MSGNLGFMDLWQKYYLYNTCTHHHITRPCAGMLAPIITQGHKNRLVSGGIHIHAYSTQHLGKHQNKQAGIIYLTNCATPVIYVWYFRCITCVDKLHFVLHM